MASCKVAGVFQCTNCVCSKSKSCSKNCACRGLCRGAPDVNVASIEVNEVVEGIFVGRYPFFLFFFLSVFNN